MNSFTQFDTQAKHKKIEKRSSDVALYLQGVQVPINPEKIKVKIKTEKNTYVFLGTGEADILHGAKLDEIEIELLFPADNPHYAQTEDSPGQWIASLKAAHETGTPIELVYVGAEWDINMDVSINEPEFEEEAGSRDIKCKFKARRFVDVKAIVADVAEEERPRASSAAQATENPKEAGKTYTVKEGDTLWHIAKCTLGSGARYEEIYELNKDTIGNPNVIRAGQTIKLPAEASGTVTQRSGSSRRSSNKSQNTAKSGGSSSTTTGGKTAGAMLPGLQEIYNQATYNGSNQLSETYGRGWGGRAGSGGSSRGGRNFGGR